MYVVVMEAIEFERADVANKKPLPKAKRKIQDMFEAKKKAQRLTDSDWQVTLPKGTFNVDVKYELWILRTEPTFSYAHPVTAVSNVKKKP
jgi:hypothetical protein